MNRKVLRRSRRRASETKLQIGWEKNGKSYWIRTKEKEGKLMTLYLFFQPLTFTFPS